MNKDLASYVKIYKGALDKSFCSDIVSRLEKQTFNPHTFLDANTGVIYRNEGELDCLDGSKNDSEYQPLMDTIKRSFNTYTKDMQFPWFEKAGSFCTYRYNKYLPNTKMTEHCDHIHSIFDGKLKGVPILTTLGFLNDDYEGGDLILFGDTKVEVSVGDIMVFPSNFLYPHRVEKVTKGVRYSFVSWAW